MDTWPPSSAVTRSRSARRTGSSTRSSRSRPSPGWSTTAGTTRRPRRRPRSCSATTACVPSRRSAASEGHGPARHRHLDVHRDVRAGAVARARGARLRRRWLGARARSGCCRPARSRSSSVSVPHGQGHETAFSQIVADRLGVPFEDVEILHGDTRSCRGAWTPTAPARSPSAAWRCQHAADKVIEKAKVIAAHMLEASVDDIEFDAGTFTASVAPTRARRSAEVAFAVVRRATTSPRASSRTSTRRRRSTRRTSRSRTAPTCAPSRSTPRPADDDPAVRRRRRRRHGGQPA